MLGLRSSANLDAHHTPDVSARAVEHRLQEWRTELVTLLGESRFDDAVKLGPPQYKHGKPVFDQHAA
jgi:hypothetical protein